ncbi:MAG: hypothetical protein AB8H03_22175 [Saprospiraceae bacterium]
MNAQQKFEIQLPIGRKDIKVEIFVRFGNPKDKNCRNFGICKISESQLPNVIARQREKCSNAILIFEKKSLIICFDKLSMSEKTKSIFFRNEHFVIDAEKLIPNTISKKINHTDLLIPKGNYLIREKQGYFFIDVPWM